MSSELLRQIPSVTELLDHARLKPLVDQISHAAVLTAVRAKLDELRNNIRQSSSNGRLPTTDDLARDIARRVERSCQPRLREVINATGILLHTGLGRAPLPEEAIAELVAIATGYASVELDLESGERSQRLLAVEGLLREITGAEAALVVNNNAGATMLALAALASGREVIVSRGELVEIGGSFRLPDVMSASGAVLREVGTTNRTRLSDYSAAINDRTAAIMRVHTSNYRIIGFTESVGLVELLELGRKHRIPVLDDIGSGALIDLSEFGLADEPTATESIKLGADLTLFSGDKLLGGPQCGIMVGNREHVERVARHPMMRALRVDKLTLAALAATLRLYRDPAQARARLPLLRLLSTPEAALRVRAERIAEQLTNAHGIAFVAAEPGVTYLGGGSVPAQEIVTWCVAISPQSTKLDEVAMRLRNGRPSIVARIQRNALMLDLRSVFENQDELLVHGVRQALQGT